LTLTVPKHYKADVIDRDGSYTILILDENLDSFKGEFIGLSQVRKYVFKNIWNSEPRFIVAGVNEFLMLQKRKYSHYGIYNSTILSIGHYVIIEVYSSPQTVMV
jgi:hypothetical protein